jgi:hypothetical protein
LVARNKRVFRTKSTGLPLKTSFADFTDIIFNLS